MAAVDEFWVRVRGFFLEIDDEFTGGNAEEAADRGLQVDRGQPHSMPGPIKFIYSFTTIGQQQCVPLIQGCGPIGNQVHVSAFLGSIPNRFVVCCPPFMPYSSDGICSLPHFFPPF